MHALFRIPGAPGLTEGLRADSDSKMPTVAVSDRLWILPAGAPDPDPLGGLSSARMRRIIEDAASAFDWVVIDTPPLALLPDAHLLATMADAVVLVIAAGSTPYALIQRALKVLDRERIAGVVLNRAEAPAGGGYYYYGQSSAAEIARGRER
jgi:Mrp family chromosome partitioning ATPase